MNCESCKHWSPKSESEWNKDDIHRECTRIKMYDEYVTAKYKAEYEKQAATSNYAAEKTALPVLEEQMAYVCDGSSYYAGLFTRGDFVCPLYEAA